MTTIATYVLKGDYPNTVLEEVIEWAETFDEACGFVMSSDSFKLSAGAPCLLKEGHGTNHRFALERLEILRQAWLDPAR